MMMLLDLTKVFYEACKLCSRQDAPLSCYVLIVQGIKNAVDRDINGDNGKFDWILGLGSAKEIKDVIDVILTWMVPSLLAARLDSLMSTIFGVS
jgi:hypothetical protein